MGQRRHRFRGQGMVEFAIVGPLFFIMLLGTIEMGRLMWISHELSNGTREGARWASVRGARSGETVTDADVEGVIIDRTSGLSAGSLNATVDHEPDNEPGSKVIVATNYQYQPLMGAFLGIDPITLSRQSELTIHY